MNGKFLSLLFIPFLKGYRRVVFPKEFKMGGVYTLAELGRIIQYPNEDLDLSV